MSTPPTIAALHTSMLTDDDVAELTNDEFRLWIMAMVKVANDRSRGVVKVGKPALVQRWACLPEGKDACAEAIAGLLEKGRFVRDDEGIVRVRNWDRFQEPVTGLLEPEDPDVYVAPAPDETEDPDGLPTLKQMKATFCAIINDTLPEVDKPHLAYRVAFDAIDDLLRHMAEQGGLSHYAAADKKSGNTETETEVATRLRNELRFACVQHAVGSTFGARFQAKNWGRVRQKVKALGKYGDQWVIAAVLAAAGADISGEPTSYILRTAERMRDDDAAAKAGQPRAYGNRAAS